MGRLTNESGTEIEQSAFTTSTYTTSQAQPAVFTVQQNVYEEDVTIPGSKQRFRKLKYKAGDKITQAQMDAAYAEATVTTINPTSGPIAGGTNVTITGTNLTECRGVTFGGAAATNFVVVSDTQITCTTPAGTAGAKSVVFDLAAGDVTKASFFTYV